MIAEKRKFDGWYPPVPDDVQVETSTNTLPSSPTPMFGTAMMPEFVTKEKIGLHAVMPEVTPVSI